MLRDHPSILMLETAAEGIQKISEIEAVFDGKHGFASSAQCL